MAIIATPAPISPTISGACLLLMAVVDGMGITLGPLPVIDELLASGKLQIALPGPAVRVRGYSWVVPLALAADPLCAGFCARLEHEGGAWRRACRKRCFRR